MKADPGFTSLLKNLDLNRMDESSDVIYILDNHFILRAFNSAWEIFAKENNGAGVLGKFGLGTLVIDVISEPLKAHYSDLYSDLYRKALTSATRIDSEYECSSDKICRKFRQSLYPLKDRAGILVSNHLEIAEPYEAKSAKPSPKHVSKEGMIVQCSHCRRTKDQTQNDKWDWIPEFFRKMPGNTSHGLCGHCYDFYYPDFPKSARKTG